MDRVPTILVFIAIISFAVRVKSVREVHFTLDNSCPGRVVNAIHCPHIIQASSKLQCARQCSLRSGCVTFVRDSNQGNCRLCKTVPMIDCANTVISSEKAYRMTVTPDSCQNGGNFTSEWRCSCPAGFAGDWCERPLFDCKEARTLGYPTGVYHIQPALASQPFPAYCTTPKYGRTYISKRHSANPLFNRSWHEYRNGFGDPAGNYWIGLENLYLLTNSGLRYSFKMEPRLENNTFYQHYYNNFKLGPESDKYRLHYDSTGTNVKKSAGDCLALSLGAPFSTYDADNDGDVTENCAQRHQSGWWFPEGDCSLTKCNPHGVLVQSPGALWSGKPEDVFWINDFGNLLVWNIVTWLHRD